MIILSCLPFMFNGSYIGFVFLLLFVFSMLHSLIGRSRL